MTAEVLSPTYPRHASGTLFGHPKGLAVLFSTEMWERFSYYGMRALLVLYMVKFLLLPQNIGQVVGFAGLQSSLDAVFGKLDVQQTASQIYGLYTAFVYLTPVLGGWLADSWLGQRRTVIIGALLMSAGHFLMAFQSLFLIAMLLLIFGVGIFKPNVTAQVGGLYAPGDSRRDRAYSIYYVGINLGAFLSPLVCGTLGEEVGWHWGFAAAGVGMLISLFAYLMGQRHLPPDPRTRSIAKRAEKKKLTGVEWRAVWAIVGLCVLNIFFWAIYEQQGNTLSLWSDANVDRSFAFIGLPGVIFPTTWVQAINPFMIFTLTPVITSYWARQATKGTEPTSVSKMAIGCFLGGLSYCVLALAAVVAGTGKASCLWLLLYFFVLTVGELYLSPIGLSLVSKVAPERIISVMMGTWFLAMFVGNYMAGWLGTFWELMPHTSFFLVMAAIGAGAGFAIWVVNRPIQRMMVEEQPLDALVSRLD